MSLLPVGFGASGDDYEITDSLRLRSSASAYLSRTFSTPTDGKVWTYSVWVKRAKASTLGHGTGHFICTAGSGAQGNFGWGWNNVDDIAFIFGGYGRRYTTGLFRDPSAWYHIVLKIDTTQATEANRALLYVNGALFPWNTQSGISQNSTTQINQAVAHNIGRQTGQPYQSFDGYMTEANFIDGQALDPTEFGEYDANGTWKAKDYTGTYGNNGFYLPMKPTTQAELQNTVLYAGNTDKQSIDGVGYAPDFVWIKNRTGANNHFLYDTIRGTDRSLLSNSTSAESVGAQQLTSFDTDGFTVPYDVSGYNNYAGRSYVAWTWDAGDNQTSTGISSVLYVGQGVAQSVKGFGFSPDLIILKNRAAASPLLIDSVRGPFFELQPNSTGAETSNSGTRFASIDADGFSFADTAVSGLNQQNNNYVAWGWDAGDGDPVSNTTGDINSTVKANDATGFSIVSYTGNGTSNSEQTIGHGLSTAPKVVIVKDRTSASTRWTFYSTDLSSDATYAVKNLLLNSSAAESAYSSQIRGIQGSNTFSVRDVDANGNANVNKSGDNYIAYCFSEVSGVSKFSTYTGTGSSGKAITGLGFRPGFLMIKEISSTGNWAIVDGTRSPFGEVTGAYLYANLSQAEGGGSAPLQFDSDGFTINSGDSDTNASGQTYIYMAFKGSYSDYVSPLNDTGTIDSRVKANTEKGFSIVSFTAPSGTGNFSVGHGLGVTPGMVIVKTRDSGSAPWYTWQNTFSNLTNDYIRLNASNAKQTQTDGWGAGMTSSVIGLKAGSTTVATEDHIAYCFAEVAGYSKIGSYTGTGTTTGNVTTVGFRPAFLMVKGTSLTSEWVILDNTRDPNPDPAKNVLMPNNTNADSTAATGLYVKFTDTGFQPVGAGTDTNSSGATYIYMAFADTRDAVFNFDASGNKNNWLPNNINSNAESESTYDLMKDTPSLVDENAGNFATLNPLQDSGTLSNANLRMTGTFDNYRGRKGTMQIPSSGKWYWEYNITVQNTGAGNWTVVGVCLNDKSLTGYPAGTGYIGYGERNDGRNINNEGTQVTASSNIDFSTGDVLQVAYDVDTGKFWFGRNNTWFDSSAGSTGNPSTGANATLTAAAKNWHPFLSHFTNNNTTDINFGQRPFAYTPPTGFKKLNTFNLPDSTIEKGDDYFNTVTFSGNGSGASVTGVNFQPDFIWAKNRTNAYNHELWDAIRGVNSELQSNSTAAEITDINRLVSFDSDGFSYGTSSNLYVNGTNSVAWNWKANGSGVSNNVGSIPSTVSVNTTAGFSIVSWSGNSTNGATIGHGLGTAPNIILTKCRSHATSWIFGIGGMSGFGVNDYLNFQTTGTKLSSTTFYQGYSANTFQVGVSSADEMNKTGRTYISYVFSEVPGYSAFGSYTGNTSTDGPFIYTGFRPAWVMLKRTDAAGHNWFVLDATRNSYNVLGAYLNPNTANAEASTTFFDFTSNGFKLRATSSGINTGTIIYMAFAENPFKNANAR